MTERSLMDRLLAESGVTREDFDRAKKRAEATGKGVFVPNQRVEDSPELRRIVALPRRRWEDTAQRFVEQLTELFRQKPGIFPDRPGGGKQRLRPPQAAALAEIHYVNGLLMAGRVGSGKTLVSFLAPVFMEAKRPLLLVPAKLLEKTHRDMQAYRKDWLIPGHIRTVSYELLGRPQSAKLLEEHGSGLGPDLIIADECHRLRNTGAAVTKRIKRWMEAHPETRMVALSGTIMKRSIKDYAHIAEWCLRGFNPTPRDYPTREEWGMVLDQKTGRDADVQRVAPGALIVFCNDEEKALYAEDPVRAVRKGFQRRLTETYGVVATSDIDLGVSLLINSHVLKIPSIADAAKMIYGWTRPDGEPIMDAIEVWRHLNELACGLWYRWNPSPPDEWKVARRAYAKAVREILRHNQRGLDSEAPVRKAILDGLYPQARGVLDEWKRIEPTFTPRTETVWASRVVLDYCAAWMEKEPGLVWVQHTEFGRELAKMTKVKFYQREGVDHLEGRPIEDHKPGTPMILSIQSNSEGRNLQAWNSNLFTYAPTTGLAWEQALGRTHRDGQEADEVTATLVVSLAQTVLNFDRARADARTISDITGQEQKLCYADVDVIEASKAPTGLEVA